MIENFRYIRHKKEPLLTDEHKEKRMKFANWIRRNSRKANMMNILSPEEQKFNIDGVYNSQNDQIWAVNRVVADIKGGIRGTRKFPQKIMVWPGMCSKGVSPLVIVESDTFDHDRYIREVFPVALKHANDIFGDG